MTLQEEKNWAMLIHLSALVGFIIPFGHVLIPLILWSLKKDESNFVDEHGKEAVNFQITMTILAIIFGILSIFCIGIFLLLAQGVFILVVVILAAVNASDGKPYVYPLSFRIIK